MNRKFLTGIVSLLVFGSTVVGCDEEKDESGQEESMKSGEEAGTKGETGSEEGNDDDSSSSGGSESGEESTGDGESGQSEGTGNEVPDDFKGKMNPYDIDDTDAVSEGEELYGMNCAGCHGRNGEGSIGPNVSNSMAAAWADDFYLWKITDGVGTVMPPQKDKLSEDEIWKIVTFVRMLQN